MHARLRMLMNSQPNDGSPGGAPSGTGAPATPPAQGSGTPDVIGQVKELLAGELKGFRDGIFADLRKAGALGKGEKREDPKPTEGGQPLTTADVERMTTRANQFGRATAGLSDEQVSLMERLYRAENPEDVAAWAKETRAALGIAGGNVQPPNPSRPPAAPPNPKPVSDAGGPAAPTTLTEDTPLAHMKPEDRQHLIATKGLGWYAKTLRAQLKGTKVTWVK